MTTCSDFASLAYVQSLEERLNALESQQSEQDKNINKNKKDIKFVEDTVKQALFQSATALDLGQSNFGLISALQGLVKGIEATIGFILGLIGAFVNQTQLQNAILRLSNRVAIVEKQAGSNAQRLTKLDSDVSNVANRVKINANNINSNQRTIAQNASTIANLAGNVQQATQRASQAINQAREAGELADRAIGINGQLRRDFNSLESFVNQVADTVLSLAGSVGNALNRANQAFASASEASITANKALQQANANLRTIARILASLRSEGVQPDNVTRGEISNLSSKVNQLEGQLDQTISSIGSIGGQIAQNSARLDTKINNIVNNVTSVTNVTNNTFVQSQPIDQELLNNLDRKIDNLTKIATVGGVAIAAPALIQLTQGVLTGTASQIKNRKCCPPVQDPKTALQLADIQRQTKVNGLTGATNVGLNGTILAQQSATNASVQATNATAQANNSLIQTVRTNLTNYTQIATERFNKIVTSGAFDKSIQAMNFAVSLHNAMMLSRDLGESIIFMLDSVGEALGLKDANGEPIFISQIVSGTFQNIIINIIGAENYVELQINLANLNRIYQAGANLLDTVTNLVDDTRNIAETTGNYVGTIGNALRESGAVLENAYEPMQEQFDKISTTSSRFENFFNKLEQIEDATSSVESIAGDVTSIRETIKELEEQKKEFNDAVKQAELDRKNKFSEDKLDSEASIQFDSLDISRLGQ